MKKLFASLLAATMIAGMSVSAFALTVSDETADFTLAEETYTISNDEAKPAVDEVNGGTKIYYPIMFASEDGTTYSAATKFSQIEDLTAKVKATIGKELIEQDAKIVKKTTDLTDKKAYYVEIEVKDFYAEDEKEIELEISLYNKGRKQYNTDDATKAPKTVFNLDNTTEMLKNGLDLNGVAAGATPAPGALVKFRSNSLEIEIDANTGIVQLDEAKLTNDSIEAIEEIVLEGDAFNYIVRASEQGALWLEANEDADKEIVMANQDADMTFINFPGAPEFDFNGTMTLYVEDTEKTYFAYENVDGVLSPVGKYDSDAEGFVVKTNELTNYVISDMELTSVKDEEVVTPEEDTTTKPVPDTGAIA